MSITRPIAGKDSPQRARLSDEAIDMSPMKVSVRRPPSGGKPHSAGSTRGGSGTTPRASSRTGFPSDRNHPETRLPRAPCQLMAALESPACPKSFIHRTVWQPLFARPSPPGTPRSRHSTKLRTGNRRLSPAIRSSRPRSTCRHFLHMLLGESRIRTHLIVSYNI